jgi:succinate dehydrogenase / fumarate reductase, flavoprotein subunit
VQNMLKVSEVIVRCAIERRESRGAQWRLDYPNLDPAWDRKVMIATWDGDTVRITTDMMPDMPPELKALFDEGH